MLNMISVYCRHDMMETKFTQILILCTFVKIAALTYGNKSCELIKGQLNPVEWPATTNKTLSTPPCVDENKEFLYRECQNEQWGPEPLCFYIQSEKPKCPEGFIALERMCYMFTSASTYPPQCPSQDVLPFAEYKSLIPVNAAIWMPVERDLSNGLGFFQWMEAGTLYKTDFTDYTIGIAMDTGVDIENLNCVVSFGGDNMEVSSCNESYPGLCAYKITAGWVSNEICESMTCAQKDFFDKSKCICQGEAPDVKSSDVEFFSLHQNNGYYQISTNTCSIALQKLENGTYVWTKSMQEINYTYWLEDVVFDTRYIYGAATIDGPWILTESPLQCFAYVLNLTMEEPSLDLTILNNTLTLQITNVAFLKQIAQIPVYCFTNADATTLVYRYPTLQKMSENGTTMALKFETVTDAPGDYWCEGFRFDNSTVIRSNVVSKDLEYLYLEFVILLSVNFTYGVDPVSQSTINIVDNTLFKIFRKDDELKQQYTIRVMKFIKVDYDNCTVLINLHITSTKTQGEEEYDFTMVMFLVQDFVLSIEGMKMVDFLSARYCYREKDGNLTWPQTLVGDKATPYEFCFNKNGTLIRRLCDGSFIDGARWSKYENCEILSKSTLSNSLLSILRTESNEEIQKNVYEISRRYSEIKSLDLYLIGKIFQTVDTSNVSVETIAKTMNNIFQISNSNIFKEAQLKTKAVDTILTFLDDILMNYNGSFDIGLTNFIFTFLNTGSLSGLVVLNNNNVQVLHDNHSIDDIQRFQDINSAVWLNAVQNQSQKVSFSIFFNDKFFAEAVDILHDVRIIFGVVLPQFTSVKIIKKVEYNERAKYCLEWNYKNHTGAWTTVGLPKIYSSFAVCEYWYSGYFGLALVPKDIKHDNITHDLIDVLTANDSSFETMQRLSDITQSYKDFEAIDVSYIGKILEKVSTDQVDLKCLANTINNLQQIERNVLFESQMEERSTDIILYFVDAILNLQEQQDMVQILVDNFMILIINATNFGGIALLNGGNSYQIKILTETSSIGDILGYDNFESAVLVDSGLKNQMKNDSKIIITVFKNDVLFNERDSKQLFVSKVFGIILPEIGEYSGPVSVLHKINVDNTSNHCVYWNYNNSINATGFWKEDNSTKKVPFGVSQCDFWHTTHFAFLVVDSRSINLNSDTLDWLDVMVTVNSVMSLIGLGCIVCTAVLFKKWRSNTGNQILLNFVVILIFQISAFYISSNNSLHLEHYSLCITVGVVLHYCTISQFFWMLVVAMLQFHRLVVVLRAPPKRILLKACLFGWVPPLVPVITVLIVDKDSYVRSSGLCYPSDWSLYLGVWLPVSVVVATNGAIFVYILYNLIYKKAEIVKSGNSEVIYQVRLAILLFFMFGLTWVFGFISNFHNARVFLYLFCCTSSLQGFVIFLFFIVCNPNTKYLYVRKCCQKSLKK